MSQRDVRCRLSGFIIHMVHGGTDLGPHARSHMLVETLRRKASTAQNEDYESNA